MLAALFVDQALAAHRHGRHFAAAGGQAIAHQVVSGELAGAGEQAAMKLELADLERFVRWRSGRRTAADQGDDLDLIASRQLVVLVFGPRHDSAIDLDGDPVPIDAQFVQ